MGGTKVELDAGLLELVERIRSLYGLRTTREAIDFALRRAAGAADPRAILELQGMGWEGDLEAMRSDEFPEL